MSANETTSPTPRISIAPSTTLAPPWAGVEFTCTKCSAEYLLEAGDQCVERIRVNDTVRWFNAPPCRDCDHVNVIELSLPSHQSLVTNNPLSMTLDEHAIYDDLRGTECVCGATKARGNSFCRNHYFELPPETRRQLYARDGYCETFRAACELLGLQPPAPDASVPQLRPDRFERGRIELRKLRGEA